jgi:hypothetical protein
VETLGGAKQKYYNSPNKQGCYVNIYVVGSNFVSSVSLHEDPAPTLVIKTFSFNTTKCDQI